MMLFGDWRAARSVRIFWRSLLDGRSETGEMRSGLSHGEQPRWLLSTQTLMSVNVCENIPGSGDACGFSCRYGCASSSAIETLSLGFRIRQLWGKQGNKKQLMDYTMDLFLKVQYVRLYMHCSSINLIKKCNTIISNAL